MDQYHHQDNDQEAWDESNSMHYSSNDNTHTAYPMHQTTLSMPLLSDAGGYGYLPTTSASHDNTGSFGSFAPPHTPVTQEWGMSYSNAPWTGSSMPATTYAVAQGDVGSHLIASQIMLGNDTVTGFRQSILEDLTVDDEQEFGYDDFQPPALPTGFNSSPPQLSCEPCEETFANQKNWDRHLLSEKHIHNMSLQGMDSDAVPKFKCACNYVQARKDNYRRHLKHCTFRIDFAYHCSCGEWTQDKAYHEHHIDLCGRKRRGRAHRT
ncbi:hypothetical protein QBC36DRAFT_22671 [Triangularia setosa]|uniref:C2H2-type domain-containing protein n=1 Tax=Triangularia setosa TaxID=2587417 RepID=A0AAN7A7S1_9PEZI|nr:hypothetical protein QBC36DRAFT_22671 [Podospora setosa]